MFSTWVWALGLFSLSAPAAGAAVAAHRFKTMPAGSTLYAFGPNISALPVFYADGKAYIGNVAPEGASTVMNVTFTLNNTILYATPSATTTTNTTSTNTTKLLTALNPTTNANDPVEFVSSTSDTTLSTSGFMFYGNQLSWRDSDGTIVQNFWAAPVTADTSSAAATTDDEAVVYSLTWNANNTAVEGSVPVLIEYNTGSTIADGTGPNRLLLK